MKWLSLMACALDSNAVGEIMNTSLVDCARGGRHRRGRAAGRESRAAASADFSSPLSSAQAYREKCRSAPSGKSAKMLSDEDVDSGVPMLRCRSTSHQPKCPLDFRQIFRDPLSNWHRPFTEPGAYGRDGRVSGAAKTTARAHPRTPHAHARTRFALRGTIITCPPRRVSPHCASVGVSPGRACPESCPVSTVRPCETTRNKMNRQEAPRHPAPPR